MDFQVIGKLLLVLAAGVGLQFFLLKTFRRLKIFQIIRDDGPQTHLQKKSTPTLGGIGLALTIIFGVLIFWRFDFEMKFLITGALLFGVLGLADDLLLLAGLGKRGLSGFEKIFLEILTASFLALVLVFNGYFAAGPVFLFLRFNWPGAYFLLAVVLILATVNTVNLTDGLDGLAAGVTLPIFLIFLIFSLRAENLSAFIFSFLLILAIFSFLIFNIHPAKIFMGDAGSHLIGGAIAGLTLLLHKEFLLLLFGGVLAAEGLSVILQVASYKLFKKRIFKMSPLHHHFEMLGWPEDKVVYAFWTVSAILAMAAIIL